MRDIREINELNEIAARNAAIINHRPAGTDVFGGGGKPQGHAGRGGIQKHSLGNDYPWTVVGYGDGTWAAENVVTGRSYPRRGFYAEAQADIPEVA